MSTTTFPNGETLTSSALTPDSFIVTLQPIVAQMLGFDTSPDKANAAYSAVRVGWQQQGQPAGLVTDSYVVLTATIVDAPFSRWRDNLYSPKDAASLTRTMGFTQIWRLLATCRGPNGADYARLILSAITFDWVHDALAAASLYLITGPNRPVYAPEYHAGQWWKRTDVELRFNESVIETLTVPSAAGVDVTLITDSGDSESFTIGQA